jgi:hypothetical protein
MKVKHLTWYWNSDYTTIQVTYKQIFKKFQHLKKMWDWWYEHERKSIWNSKKELKCVQKLDLTIVSTGVDPGF